ncbi:suppressor of fused domain protein [Hymenobacter cavernae]|uniref:Suppressor of fused-like domain-containing protein n=1 Tax=Hymenobacter cavernae TaxID=2044852 RepID=A0ABQ1U1X8_9BACT|nr:suppressor of fused domain protein [Hymenobacter cavernae]GGF06501.1 hypothetical protein GCM10011383_16970 [Hymenobacter cavernae]
MQVLDSREYTANLHHHYENYFGSPGKRLILNEGPKEKLHSTFYVLLFKLANYYCYCTVGMSADRIDDNLIELIVYSPKADKLLVELMTVCASFHRNVAPLNLHHTVNIGRPWLKNSKCDHAFISLPYLNGPRLEIFNFESHEIHCYWLIPITERERDYKIKNGCEALEQLFEDKQLDYLDIKRNCLASES